MGHEIEIHLNEDGQSGFLKIKDPFGPDCYTAPRGISEEVISGEKVLMNRIK